jgi:hypothetical protein
MTRKNVSKADNQQARRSKLPGKPYSVSEAIGKTAREAAKVSSPPRGELGGCAAGRLRNVFEANIALIGLVFPNCV